jgi:hypothetical protein
MNNNISYSLSSNDILEYLDYKPNLIIYPEIIKYDNIDSLLGENGMCVLLYLTSSNYGHWCCVYRYNDSICFFDSYGLKPDSELHFVSPAIRQSLKQYHAYLTKLLYKSNKKIEYNEYALQKRKDGINTCGRWVCTRLKYNNVSIDDFAKTFLSVNNIIKPDELVTYLTA